MSKKIAVVTGATSGMGREFVRAFDLSGDLDEIWIISRDQTKLNQVKSENKTETRVIPLDLSDTDSITKLAELLKSENPEIKKLVNASGYGKFNSVTETPLSELQGMIDLNDKALVGVTYISLKYMNAGGEIYEMGSLSSFQPVPYICVYGASKAFVLSFSRGLNVELKQRKIRVMAVCPGWVKTKFFDRAKNDDTVSYFNKMFTPEQVVERAIYDMKKGKDVSICGSSVRNQVRLTKLLPHKLVMKIWCKQQKH